MDRLKLQYSVGEGSDLRSFFVELSELAARTLPEAVAGTVHYSSFNLDEGDDFGKEVKGGRSLTVSPFEQYHSEHLALSLLYATGKRASLQHAYNRVSSNKHKKRGTKEDRVIPWGREGLLEYLIHTYPVKSLVFDGAYTELLNDRQPDVYKYAVNLKLRDRGVNSGRDNSDNDVFFDAQNMCVRALEHSLTRSSATVQSFRAIRIGELDMSNVQSREELVPFESGIRHLLPIKLKIGKLALSYKQD